MQSREPRIHKRLKSLVKVMWPGTESNCRHEDFQSSCRSGTMCHHRSLCDNIPLENSPCGYSLSPFFPFRAFRSDKVISKVRSPHGGLRVLCAPLNSMPATAFLATWARLCQKTEPPGKCCHSKKENLCQLIISPHVVASAGVTLC
jgi:hypothetical protein